MTESRIPPALLVAGAIIFWMGAFYVPMWKVWMAREPAEYLKIVGENRMAWLATNGLMGIGAVVSALGFLAWAPALRERGGLAIELVSAAWIICGVLWLVVSAQRLTVTTWMGEQHMASQVVPSFFSAAQRFDGLLFSVYMELAYLATAAAVFYAFRSGLLPPWLGWTGVAYSLAGVALYPVFILFQPPLMIHAIPCLVGVWLLKSGGAV